MGIAPELEGRGAHGVAGWWHGSGAGSGDVLPDGWVDVVWSPGRVPWIAGPDMAPRRSSVSQGSPTVGVRPRPGAVTALIGDSATALVDRCVELDVVLPGTAADRVADQLDSAALAEAGPLLAGLHPLGAGIARSGHDRVTVSYKPTGTPAATTPRWTSSSLPVSPRSPPM